MATVGEDQAETADDIGTGSSETDQQPTMEDIPFDPGDPSAAVNEFE